MESFYSFYHCNLALSFDGHFNIAFIDDIFISIESKFMFMGEQDSMGITYHNKNSHLSTHLVSFHLDIENHFN